MNLVETAALTPRRNGAQAISYVSAVASSLQEAKSDVTSPRVSNASANSFGCETVLFLPGAFVSPGDLSDLPGRGATVVVVVGDGATVVEGVGTTVVVVAPTVVEVVVSGTVVVVSSPGVAGSSSTKLAMVTDPVPVFVAVSVEEILLTEMPGCACCKRAARPATCGAAIDVPEMVRVAVDPEIHAEVMLLPGAYMSTQRPKLEYEACASLFSVAPIVKAEGARAGEKLHASAPEFPAAATTTRPAAVAFATASSRAEFAPPPRLRLITPGPPGWLATAQLMPATTEDV